MGHVGHGGNHPFSAWSYYSAYPSIYLEQYRSVVTVATRKGAGMSLIWGECQDCGLQFYAVEPDWDRAVPCPRCRGVADTKRGLFAPWKLREAS
jgi:hypothetical protein